jgi:dephospho-CoA kinase
MGSGKSLVAGIFKHLGIPVYNADQRARDLMNENDILKEGIIQLLGASAYSKDGSLDRGYIANLVFRNAGLLEKLNHLVHPKVLEDSENWSLRQDAPYSLHEAALLVQSGASLRMRCSILVSAPELMRIDRIRLRNGWTDAEILDRLKHQWTEGQLKPYCSLVITNDGTLPLIPQVMEIHRRILRDLGK